MKNLSPTTTLKIVQNVVDTVQQRLGQKTKTLFPDGKITEDVLAEDLLTGDLISREEQEDRIMDVVGPKVKIHPETNVDDIC